MVVTALAAAGSILWMQGRYEASDKRHALEIVQGYQPPGGTNIPALIGARHPEKVVTWSTAVESSCFQHIRVHAVVDEPSPQLYAFVVDINGPAIHPANDNGQTLMSQIDKPLPASTVTAASSASAAASTSSSAVPSATAPHPSTSATAEPREK